MDTPESKPDYFITADAGYCHILPQNIVLTRYVDYQSLPLSEDKKDLMPLVLGSIGVAAGCFVMVEFFIVGFMLMAVLFLIAMLAATRGLAELARYSAIKNIERTSIESAQLIKPAFGYYSLIIRFKNKEGKSSLRKIKLYDSRQNEEQAVELLRKEGLL